MREQLEKNGLLERFVNLAGIALGVLMLALVVSLASQQPATAAGGKAPADGRRAYYLTTQFFDGAHATIACDPNFHMASVWEILDVSNLKYETTLGANKDDVGSGPPSVFPGWVRTGNWESSGFPTAPGNANCSAYVTNNAGYIGTQVSLPGDWAAAPATALSPWQATTKSCDTTQRVWCVQD